MAKSVQERNVAKTAGAPHEHLVIDGSQGPLRPAGAYNRAIRDAKGDIVVFIADDLYFMQLGWGATLDAKFAADPSLGVLGVAGTQHLFADKYSWTAAGRPYSKGRIVYHLQNGDFFAVVFSSEKGDREVVACDGCFLAVRADVLRTVMFDDDAFGGGHFWDLDFCLRARSAAKVVVSTDIVVKKTAQPVFDAEWHAAGTVFLRKHASSLPTACAQYPDAPLLPGPQTQMISLKGKYSMETIC